MAAIVFTDIGRDGLLAGPEHEATIELARAVSIPVILSGGVSSLADLAAVKAAGEDILAGSSAAAPFMMAGSTSRRPVALLEGPSGWRGARAVLKVRIIPCLDVDRGRVVKGVRFVDLIDAGDPVEQARAYDAAGADELCFLDITASHENGMRFTM